MLNRLFQKKYKRRECFPIYLEAGVTLTAKADRDIKRKINCVPNIDTEILTKTRNPDLATYKKYRTWPNGVCPKSERLVKQLKFK